MQQVLRLMHRGIITNDAHVLMWRRRWATSPLNSRRLGYLCIVLMMLTGVLMRRNVHPNITDDYLPPWAKLPSDMEGLVRIAFVEPRFLMPLVSGLWLLHEMLRRHYTGELDELWLTRLSASDLLWCTSGELACWFAFRLAMATVFIQWADIFLMTLSCGHAGSLLAVELVITTLRTLEILSLIAFSSIFIWWSLLRYSDPLFMLRDLLLVGVAATGIALLVFAIWSRVNVVLMSPQSLPVPSGWIGPGFIWIRDYAIREIVPLVVLTLLWSTLAWLSYRWLEPRIFDLYRE